ncbi:MAG: YqaJ viral recombinase family protein, partial [Candidatus Thiodiazotropha sp.]
MKNVDEKPQREFEKRDYSQISSPRHRFSPFKQSTLRRKYSPFFSPKKKRLRLFSPSPRKGRITQTGIDSQKNIDYHRQDADHSYHLLYKKAASRKSLFVTPVQKFCHSNDNNYEDGLSFLSDIDDDEDRLAEQESNAYINEQKEINFQSKITNVVTATETTFTSEKRTPGITGSDHTYSLHFENAVMQASNKQVLNTLKPKATYKQMEPDNVETLRDESQSDTLGEDVELLEKLYERLPGVLHELRNSGIDPLFLKHFFEQVSTNVFPLHNIAFQLWREVVQWYSKETTTTMRYSEETKKFWKLGWRLFGGKFVRFMGGFKNMSQISTGESQQGLFNPALSDINFVVPDTKTLQTFSPYGQAFGQMAPGIFSEVISDVATALGDRSVCLSFDGKKLKQGLTDTFGDVDLLGFEEGESLQEKKHKHDELLEAVYKIIRALDQLNPDNDIAEIGSDTRQDILAFIRKLLPIIGRVAQDIRAMKAKKEYAKDKFLEQSGSNWRQSKFAFVISAIKACLYDTEEFEKSYLKVLEKLCCFCSYANGSQNEFCTDDSVYLPQQQNYRELTENKPSSDTRNIKQRSQIWHEIRNSATVTGSTFYRATGLDGLKNQREHFENVCCGSNQKQVSETVQRAMEYGTDNEINGIATLVGKVLPVIDPDLAYNEEGCIQFGLPNTNKRVVVSPDGSLYNKRTESLVSAVEIKCPTKQIHTEVPERYILQCQATMHALGVDSMYYLCWRPDLSSVFEIRKNQAIFEEALAIVEDVFGPEHPKRPNALHKNVGKLKSKIKDECKNTNFIGEFVSGVSSSGSSQRVLEPITVSHSKEMFSALASLLREGYQLKREKATEAVVFICCDLDREWSKHSLRWAPISWFPKGYSLKTDTMRKIYESVMAECNKKGLHVPAISFDGQWHNIAVRSCDNKPLTLLQLQKDVWRESERTQKSEIVKMFDSLNKNVNYMLEETGDGQLRYVCFGNEAKLPHTPKNGWKGPKKKSEKPSESNSTDERTDIPILEVIPETVAEAVVALATDSDATVSASILPHVSVEASLIPELVTCNSEEQLLLHMLLYDDQNLEETPYNENHVTVESHGVEGSYSVSNVSSVSQNIRTSGQDEHISAASKPKLSVQEATILLSFLMTDQKANKKGFWDSKTALDVIDILNSYEKLYKLLDFDLKVIIRFMKKMHADFKANESDRKVKKLEILSQFLGLKQVPEPTKSKITRRTPKCLRDIARSTVMSKVPKSVLNIAYAEYIWGDRLEKFEKEAKISNKVKVEGTFEPDFWFSQPEYSESRNKLEVKCVDSTHLFTRLRRHSCKGCLDGIDCTAWKNVAKQRTTLLTPVMIDDLTDPMSAAMARTHFSEQVEKAMRRNGDDASANLCRDIRLWWRAEDDSGISV